jgi:16S rRNA (cytidine1402-2'-O)-methyltransferase
VTEDERAAAERRGTLFVIATPIGNLEDISARALRLLGTCAVIAAEDTRVTRRLLAHFDLHTPLVSCHAHSPQSRRETLLARLLAGEDVALVSDAGTPCLSDPGAELVADAIAAGVRVEPIPGASALLAALVASGLPVGSFVFEGFLPRTNDRRERIAAIAAEPRTVVLYESSPRLVATLTELARATRPDRPVVVGRELTKKFEEFVRGTLADAIGHYGAHPPRGECVIVLSGASDGESATVVTGPTVDERLRAALASGMTVKDAARAVATATGEARRDLYARALALNAEAAPDCG